MASPNIYLPQWGHLGNGSQFMKNLDRHIRYEMNKEKYEECKRSMGARRMARAMGKHHVEGLGQYMGEIPERDYFRAMQVYGHDCWQDKQFRREWFRDNPSHRAQS